MPFWSIALKDLRLLFRDRSAMIFLFGFPLIFTGVFGSVYGGGSKGKPSPIKILYCNQDAGVHGAELLKTMQEMGLTVEAAQSPAILQEKIKKGAEAIGLALSPNYSQEIETSIHQRIDGVENPVQTKLTLLTDPAQEQVADMAKGAINGAVQRSTARLYREYQLAKVPAEFREFAEKSATKGSETPAVTLDTQTTEAKKRPSVGDLMIPGYAVYFVFMMANGVAATLLQERQDGTLRRMMSAPITRNQILFGKMLARGFIGLIQTALLFGIGKFTLHLSLELADLPGVTIVALINIFAATGLGMLIATLGKTMEQIQGMTTMAMLTMGFLSGTLIPKQFLPEAIQKISYITPHAWTLNAYQDLILRHTSFLHTIPNLIVVLIFGGVFYGLALARFKFEV